MTEAFLELLAGAPFLALLPYPEFDPVAVRIGPLAIRWYALAYVVGLLGAWRYAYWLVARSPEKARPGDIDDLLVAVTLGVVIGGRLGFVLFYKPGYYLANPLEMLYVWQGGMSFHGGFLGVVAAIWLFARRRGFAFLSLVDIAAAAAPIGLFLGRLANFVNAELYGRPSDVPWAMIFPGGGLLPRHPSQLYEAILEGLVLFLLLFLLARKGGLARRGLLSGAFLVGYGLARSFVELFREPDAYIGFLAGGLTMGQLLSLPMILVGLILIFRSRPADRRA